MTPGQFVGQLLDIYYYIVLITVLLSWLRLPPNHPAMVFTRKLTEPFLIPLRQLLPPMGGFDFSPLLLLLAIYIVRGMFP